jgi:hypothetical protein
MAPVVARRLESQRFPISSLSKGLICDQDSKTQQTHRQETSQALLCRSQLFVLLRTDDADCHYGNSLRHCQGKRRHVRWNVHAHAEPIQPVRMGLLSAWRQPMPNDSEPRDCRRVGPRHRVRIVHRSCLYLVLGELPPPLCLRGATRPWAGCWLSAVLLERETRQGADELTAATETTAVRSGGGPPKRLCGDLRSCYGSAR